MFKYFVLNDNGALRLGQVAYGTLPNGNPEGPVISWDDYENSSLYDENKPLEEVSREDFERILRLVDSPVDLDNFEKKLKLRLESRKSVS